MQRSIVVFQHVLVAMDFSPPAMTAASTSQQLASALEAKVTLAYVYPPDVSPADARARLEVLREERFSSIANVELAPIRHDHPHIAITGHAIAVGADLVVLGRHGHHDLAERLIGSTTERVVRHAPCSVLVTEPARTDTIVVAKHVLACTDFSPSSERAVHVAGEIARRFDAWVTLVHVYDLVPGLEVLLEAREAHPDHSFEAVVTAKLELLRKEVLADVPATSKVVRDKSVVTAIVDLANSSEVDLIVLSTHGRTGVTRLLLGSVAERVVRHASAPVLVVRPR